MEAEVDLEEVEEFLELEEALEEVEEYLEVVADLVEEMCRMLLT